MITLPNPLSSQKAILKVWKFPCGEVGVQVDLDNYQRGVEKCPTSILLDWQGSDDLLALMQVVDILRNAGEKHIELIIPYFPYSRQDRRCSPGEAHSLKVFTKVINSLGFSKVITFDPHSHVLEALVDNLEFFHQKDLVVRSGLPRYDILVAPDAGAEKKIFSYQAVKDGKSQVVCASKVRGPDGAITSVTLPEGLDLTGKTVCVVDDLCDGGATFIGLGEKLREKNPKTLNLYVTHGMFTKGYSKLLEIYNLIHVYYLSPIAPPLGPEHDGRIISTLPQFKETK